MLEPDVTLTDFALAIECAVFAGLCARRPRTLLRDAFVAVFALSALASGAAGVVHGYLPGPTGAGHLLLWTITMLAIVFPVWAGAVHAITTQLELERVAERSARMAAALSTLAQGADRSLSHAELAAVARDASALMLRAGGRTQVRRQYVPNIVNLPGYAFLWKSVSLDGRIVRRVQRRVGGAQRPQVSRSRFSARRSAG